MCKFDEISAQIRTSIKFSQIFALSVNYFSGAEKYTHLAAQTNNKLKKGTVGPVVNYRNLQQLFCVSNFT